MATPNIRWKSKFLLLLEYLKDKKEWPKQTTIYKGAKLGIWCSNLRNRKHTLSKEQIRLLKSIKFQWNRIDPFLLRIKELKAFRRKHPSKWPDQSKSSTHKELGRWLSKQRAKKNKGVLRSEYKILLDALGFPFEENWIQYFAKLKAFYELNNRWPKQIEFFSGVALGAWCARQRLLHNQGLMLQSHKQKFAKIGFIWNPNRNEWDKHYNLLLKFRKIHRRRWPIATEIFEGIKIGAWCVRQRQLKSKVRLAQQKVALLNNIGFIWTFPRVNLTGLRFHRLTVISDSIDTNADGKRLWNCLCECGNSVRTTTYKLSSGKLKSCGCLLKELSSKRMRKVQKISAKTRQQSAAEVQRRIDRVHGAGTIIMHKASFTNVHKEVLFTHFIHGEWKAKPINVYRGSSHPQDGRNRTNAALENRKLTEDEINKRLPGYIKIKSGTFASGSKKATFIDLEYGEWTAVASNVLAGSNHPLRGNKNKIVSMRNSNLEKYGVEYVAQVAKFALKAAKNQNKIINRRHWKSRKLTACQGGWELAVVDYLNREKIDYLWQPQVFQVPKSVLTTPKGSTTTFRPDLFLVKEKKWVEIKGYFRADAIKKWAWFSEQYPNSEIWDFGKLRELKII